MTQPPLIILDDYSTNYPTQETLLYNESEDSPMLEATSTQTLLHGHPSAFGDFDSDIYYPPSSVVPSEASSAITSESDLPSAIASEPDLPLPLIKTQKSIPKVQSGIHNFFQILSKDEIQAIQAKRKRADSDDEVRKAENVRKIERKREKKLAHRREGNRIAQQKCREKAVKVEIQSGIRDAAGNLVQVS
jgi:hypothetical protein